MTVASSLVLISVLNGSSMPTDGNGEARQRQCLFVARTRRGTAPRASVSIAARRVFEGDVELIGQRRQPGERVAELVELLVARAFAHGLGQLADFLREPG